MGEPMDFVDQQPVYHGFRPDLIFRDLGGKIVVVEIQLMALDRHHFYKTLEYRDYIMEVNDEIQVRVIVICNSIPNRFNRLLRAHNVEHIILSKSEFMQKLSRVEPKIIIIDSELDDTVHRYTKTTINTIIRRLQINKTGAKKCEGFDARVFWFPSNDNNMSSQQYYSYDLSTLRKVGNFYFDINKSLPSYIDPSSMYYPEKIALPREIIVSESALSRFNYEQLDIFLAWLKLLGKYSRANNFEDEEVILGWIIDPDIYNYKSYISSRKRLFYPLFHIYGGEYTYNLIKIKEHLKLFNELYIYSGKFPNLKKLQFCDSFQIQTGPGRLLDNRNSMESLYRSMGKEIDSILSTIDKYEWITIKITSISKQYILVMEELINHILFHHMKGPKKNFVWNKECGRCMAPSKILNEIDEEALKMSAKYFSSLNSFSPIFLA